MAAHVDAIESVPMQAGARLMLTNMEPQGIGNGRVMSLGVLPWALWLVSGMAVAQEARMSKMAKGEFTVVMKPLVLENADAASKLGRMSIDKQITGDLVATTQGQMLSAMTDVPGSAAYVAIEQVTGTLDGRQGSFVLHHRGVMDRGQPGLSVAVVPDSGTGGLAGIRGDFRILLEGGRHAYEFEYTLPDGQQDATTEAR